jgi:pSer/pThr/pTyr-binding forkhead associated (FHA) protein
VVSGPGAGRSFPLGWKAGIGREPDNAIRLDDDKVSRHHALIVQQPDGYVIKDLGSSNGTTVDGERVVEPRLLAAGARIVIGNSELVVRAETEGRP